MVKSNIAVITGTRAEYGLLKGLIGKLGKRPSLNPQVFATGMHLANEFGMTVREIEADGFQIAERIEILLSSDSPVGVGKSMGLAMIGFAEAYERRKPDLVLVLGDRFEAFCAAAAATVARIPIAHIHGGELTFGAMDDAFRHSITKMSRLHFTSTEEYRNRIIQLGEDPETVHNVGALGVEAALSLKLFTRGELEAELGIILGSPLMIVTFHPATLDVIPADVQCSGLLSALEQYPEATVVFTKANADMQGRSINELLDKHVGHWKEKRFVFTSLGQLRYLSLLRHADVVIGNSSSGIIEAPSLGAQTVNIGSRQHGRTRAESIIDCESSHFQIASAINMALTRGRSPSPGGFPNPYDGGSTSDKIVGLLEAALHDGLPIKGFHDIRSTNA